ncbi:alpha/beta fold hydrolase [Yinghuangia seranimata]|uniref:alpha/beta fold hydrolase n=1 Tax=Yinghuangia seranimata TaxID=408067 RepID=UPI00248CB68A|nr:alpha/beta hydrolase [Yinghuangia seranimata]MDI2129046.1 alpha/beta hydrolase [Yinghuangia seranimata]
MRIGEFKNDRARDRFQTAYDHALDELWPGPRTALDIPTRYGTTRAYRVGPPAEDPVVLLPGAGGNSLMWHAYVGLLAKHRTVVAVDTVGEPGASVQTTPIADGDDAATWFDDVLTGIDTNAAHVVGCSYGGWLALTHHLRHPGRTASLTLVDPAGFAEFGTRFYAWLIAGGLAAAAPRRLRPRLARLVGNSAILDTELMRLMRASMGFRRALPIPPVYSDDELRRLDIPTLVLLGERSALHDARKVAERITATAPSARVEIVPGTGHALPTDAPELVAERILDMAGR